MHDTCRLKRGPPSGGYVTIGTLILAAASAVVLVLMSGCHAAPANAFSATPGDKAVEARLKQPDTMPSLQPFDEHFVEVSDKD
jgi:hypothetical protein